MGLNEEEERVLKLVRDLKKDIGRWSFLWMDNVFVIEGFCKSMNVLFGQNMGLGKVPDIRSLKTIRDMLKRIDEKISVGVRYTYLSGGNRSVGEFIASKVDFVEKELMRRTCGEEYCSYNGLGSIYGVF